MPKQIGSKNGVLLRVASCYTHHAVSRTRKNRNSHNQQENGKNMTQYTHEHSISRQSNCSWTVDNRTLPYCKYIRHGLLPKMK
jgi:predicted lipoprotein with Yx(FWY)xxD motif